MSFLKLLTKSKAMDKKKPKIVKRSDIERAVDFNVCPKCGSILMCIDSRVTSSEYRRRRYRCSKRKCDYRKSTREVSVENWDAMSQMASAPRLVAEIREKMVELTKLMFTETVTEDQ